MCVFVSVCVRVCAGEGVAVQGGCVCVVEERVCVCGRGVLAGGQGTACMCVW